MEADWFSWMYKAPSTSLLEEVLREKRTARKQEFRLRVLRYFQAATQANERENKRPWWRL